MAPTTYTPPINTYVPLESIVLTNAASSVTFFNIAQGDDNGTYKDLVLVVSGTTSSGTNNLASRFNADSGNNYFSVFMGGDTGTFSGSQSSISFNDNGGFTTNKSQSIIQILDYTATDKHKTILTRNDVAAQYVIAYAGRWANTSAITSWTLFNTGAGVTFAAGTTISLYGIHG